MPSKSESSGQPNYQITKKKQITAIFFGFSAKFFAENAISAEHCLSLYLNHGLLLLNYKVYFLQKCLFNTNFPDLRIFVAKFSWRHLRTFSAIFFGLKSGDHHCHHHVMMIIINVIIVITGIIFEAGY